MSSLYDLDDLHIEDFNKDSARVLVFLYNYFPRKMEIYIEDISGPDEVDDYGLHSERHLSCMSAIIWLAEEGLIRYESLVKQESFDQTVLTKKSYTLLSNLVKKDLDPDQTSDLPPSVLRSRHTRIAALKHALKSKSSEKLKAEILSFILASEQSTKEYN
jgi:hypothetical protein